MLGWASSDMYHRVYQSRISSVDGQAAFLGQTPQSQRIAHLRSAGRDMNPGIPQQMSAQAEYDFLQTPEMVATASDLARLPEEDPLGRKQIYRERIRLRKEALRRFQTRWLEEDYLNTVSLPDLKKCSAASDNVLQRETDFDILRPFI